MDWKGLIFLRVIDGANVVLLATIMASKNTIDSRLHKKQRQGWKTHRCRVEEKNVSSLTDKAKTKVSKTNLDKEICSCQNSRGKIPLRLL